MNGTATAAEQQSTVLGGGAAQLLFDVDICRRRIVCPYQKLYYRPGARSRGPGHIHMSVLGELRYCREVGRLCGKYSGRGVYALILNAAGRDTEASRPLPPSTLGPNPVLQLVGRAVGRQGCDLPPQFNKLWIQINLKEAWEPIFPHR